MDNRQELKITAREDYLDYAKGIGIFLVVWAHIITWQEGNLWFKQIIYHFHMPLFFIISGFTLAMREGKKEQSFKECLIKDLKALMLPCVTWSIIYSFFEAYNKIRANQSVIRILGKKAWAFVTFRGIAPLWFLGALFLSKVFFEIFMRTVNRKRSQILTCICIVILALCSKVGLDAFKKMEFTSIIPEYAVTSAFRFFPLTFFLMVGYEFGLYRELLKKYAGQFFLIFFAAFWMGWYRMGCRINLQLLNIASLKACLFLGVVGSLMTITFCMLLPKGLALNKLGRASLDIMVLHCTPLPFYDWEVLLFTRARYIPTPFWIALALTMFCYAVRCYVLEPVRKLLRGRKNGNLDRDLSGTAK